MIKTFANKKTRELFEEAKCKWLPYDAVPRVLRKLDMLDSAVRVSDLRIPPGNRLHEMSENRCEQYSISINDQWRICFRFEGEDAFDVEVCDYH